MNRPRIIIFDPEPKINAVIALLRLLKIKVNKYSVVDTLKSHPDWPSLLSISDALKKWHVPNAAARATIDEIDQIPTPFLVQTRDINQPLYIVTDMLGDQINILDKDFSKTIGISRSDFNKKWTGVFLLPEPETYAIEANYIENFRQSWLNTLLPIALTLIGIFASLYNLLHTQFTPITHSKLFSILEFSILLTGIVISILLLWYEIDKNNPVLQKVCTGMTKGDCNAILSSKQSRLFSWLSWSEVGFIYFGGSFLTLLFLNPLSYAISFLAFFHFLAIPYTGFSIYYQWKIVRQWCVLCLVVQALLVIGFINSLTIPISWSFLGSPNLVFTTLLLYSIPAMLWFVIKPVILRLQKSQDTELEYNRFKYNTEIFDSLLKKEPLPIIPGEELGINIGKPDATNMLIKVCNPYCGPCAKAHPKIENLLHEVDNLKVKIIFTSKNDDHDRGKAPVSHLLAIAEQNDSKLKERSLDDWYLAEKKDYKLYAEKYPLNGELAKQGDKINSMSEWCTAVNIEHTPTFFLNGYKVPDAYDLNDLKYFLQG